VRQSDPATALLSVCNEVVERDGLVKGYEFAKDQYVKLTDDELKALEGEASKAIEIAEFVPLSSVDPIYFEKTYYLGPDKGGEKPYRLLADAMTQAGKVALAKFIMRGKENLVLVRSAQNGLMLHAMYFADEVRSFDEVSRGEVAKISGAETNLAIRLIDELSNEQFNPEQYEDEYRQRVLDLVNTKAEGKEITVAEPQVHRAQVIDLMEALKESLGKKVAREKSPRSAPNRPSLRKARKGLSPPRNETFHHRRGGENPEARTVASVSSCAPAFLCRHVTPKRPSSLLFKICSF
jgi:DNA end-binding protein Ku